MFFFFFFPRHEEDKFLHFTRENENEKRCHVQYYSAQNSERSYLSAFSFFFPPFPFFIFKTSYFFTWSSMLFPMKPDGYKKTRSWFWEQYRDKRKRANQYILFAFNLWPCALYMCVIFYSIYIKQRYTLEIFSK